MIKYTFNKTSNNSAANKMNNIFLNNILSFAPYLTGSKKTKKYKTTINGVDLMDFAKACKFLDNYNKFNYGKDEYDFELSDGTPVRIYSDEIQIGYDLIPMYQFNKPEIYFDTPKKRKIIIDIAMKLSA